jgi:hypothetical protein
MNEERTGLRQTEHIHGYFWHIYSVEVNQVTVATVRVMTGNPDRNHKLLDIWKFTKNAFGMIRQHNSKKQVKQS